MRRSLDQKMRNFNLFRAEVKRELTLRYWTYEDLAGRTGYAPCYIQHLMSGAGSKKAAFEVMKALNIDTHQFR